MCDEPTGNLDKKNSEIVFNIFEHLTKEFNQTFLMVTNDIGFAEKNQRIIEMERWQDYRPIKAKLIYVSNTFRASRFTVCEAYIK